jgi:hypothetical protein
MIKRLELLDGETVFQTVDGTKQVVYNLPSTEYMCSLVFPLSNKKLPL